MFEVLKKIYFLCGAYYWIVEKYNETVMLESKENGDEIKKPCFRCDACPIEFD